MSHHLDTPLAAQTGQLFLDDLYVFAGSGSTVLVMDVNSNVNGLHSEPGFHPEARYEFKVHAGGADVEDLTYRFSFGEPEPGGRVQPWRLETLAGAAARQDDATGELVLEGRTGQAASGGGVRVWAGRIADSFYIDLSLLAIVNAAVAAGTGGGPVGVAAGGRAEQLRRHDGGLDRAGGRACGPGAGAGDPDGGVGRHQAGHRRGGWRQVNRAGHPMMWPIFWPDDTDFSDPANTRHRLRMSRRRPSTLVSRSPPRSQPAGPPPTRRVMARRWPPACSPTCCPT